MNKNKNNDCPSKFLEHSDATALVIVTVTFHKTLPVCQGGVDFWHSSIVGKVAGDPCLFSYWSVGLHARPADEFFCNNLYSAGVWLAFGPPSSILCDCTRAAEVLHCSSLKVHPNSDFHPLQIFITDQTQSLLKGIKKKSGIRQMFWNNGE